MKRQHRGHFVLVVVVDVLVDGVAGQFDLAEPEMHGGGFGDVHDLAVGGHHEDEPVQGLEQMRAELLDGQVARVGRDVLRAPGVPKSWKEEEGKEE